MKTEFELNENHALNKADVSKSALKFRCFYANGFAIQGEPDLETLGSFMHHYSDCELQQSTGLKDATGKEIFEGDFLGFMHHLHKVFRVNGGLVINSHSDDFYKDYTPFYEACADMHTSQWIEQCKIIGNIHQNTELLIKPNWC
jgi:uncharacterized phage protein (TIGR01671 family)